ncbi:MAG: hypothetical protein ABFC24_05800 [Methanoregulaceae archaeon]
MRTPNRDRCRSAIAALCIAVILLAVPASAALTVKYTVLPNGSAYLAEIQVNDTSGYTFAESGVLGERVPVKVSHVSLSGDCDTCNFTWKGDSEIGYAKGNYTLSFMGPIRDNHLVGTYDKQYNVTVNLPSNFSVTNPLLAGLSQGAAVTHNPDNSTLIQWNTTKSFDLRFYDESREALLYLFGNFWIVIAIIFLLPFLLTMKRKPPA